MAAVVTRTYHITHLSNLATIVVAGELRCYRLLNAQATGYTNIAHNNIQGRRASTHVPCGPQGTLHDYVPFYFAPRSPMLYVLKQGGVTGYQQGQTPIVHLVSSVQAVAAAGLGYVFTDGHAAVTGLTEFFDDPANLTRIDWPLMTATYWRDTPEDNDRCRRRQAEFLVRDSCPWGLIDEIGVINAAVGAQVQALLGGAAAPVVNIHRDWYY